MKIEQVDFVAVYLCSELDKIIYIEQLLGFEQEEKDCHTDKSKLV